MSGVRRLTLAELPALVGHEVALSDWLEIDQSRIDHFAEATFDRQWIHVDPSRAAAGPFGTTIAHGFLTLSLLSHLAESAFEIVDSPMGVNYGLDRVRFPAPLPSGGRVRGRFVLASVEPVDGGVQLAIDAAVESEGGDRPVCVARWLVRRYG